MAIKISSFGNTKDGENVTLYSLINENGIQADIIDYGACLVNLLVPDKNGDKRDVALGFDNVQDYENNTQSFGAVVGRNCNRIADAKFTLNETQYTLAKNDGDNNLHSGPNGYGLRMWEAYAVEGEFGQCLKLNIKSADGDQGFPGRMYITVTYILTNEGHLHIAYYGISDKDTIINMTNHTYFNLNGHNSGSIDSHMLQLRADSYTPNNSKLIPTGEIKSVEGTPFDFRTEKSIGQDVSSDHEDIKLAGGYDHNFVLMEPGTYRRAGTLRSDESGISMEVITDQPGIQLYTSNFLDGTILGKEQSAYQKRGGVCLETQAFPDAPNHPNFPSSILKAGELFLSRTTYKFSV